MLEFQIFRIQVYLPQQTDMFEPTRTPAEILRMTIASVPSAELRAGVVWHIGNISE